MRQLTLLIILAILAFSACQNPVKKVSETSLKDSIQNDSIAKEEGTIRDTSWGDWNIHIQVKENNLLVKGCNWHPKDSSYFITMTYKGKKVFDRLEIDRYWLGGKNSYTDSLSTKGGIEKITNTTVYLWFNIFTPDEGQEGGQTMYVAFSKDGTTQQYNYDVFGGNPSNDDLVNFFIFYSHELEQSPIDKASLKKIAKDYCTPKFCKELEDKNIKILPDSWPIIKQRIKYFTTDDHSEEACTNKSWVNTLYFCSDKKRLDSLKVEFVANSKKHNAKVNAIIRNSTY